MWIFDPTFGIEENHNLHCRRAQASAVRCVLSPGLQGRAHVACRVQAWRQRPAHLDQISSCRRAPAGRLTALGRSTARWCPRLQICAATRQTSRKESPPNACMGSRPAPRLTLRGRRRCTKEQPSAECHNSSIGSSERRIATRKRHGKASKASTRKGGLPAGPYPGLFESADAASVRERMVTACNVPASAAPVLCTQTTWTACASIARRRQAPAPAGAAN